MARAKRQRRARHGLLGRWHRLPWRRPSATRGGGRPSPVVETGAARAEWLHEFDFPAALSEIPTARRHVAEQAEACGLSGPALFDLLLAVGEALANAVKHGSPRRQADRVHVRVGVQDGGVIVEVRDQGNGFDASPICPPEVYEAGGRGIPFMRALLDDLRFDCHPTGTSVLLFKRIG
jgi:anti-sigma regulatory factor (Ser/Thr protein kinase)